jgi:hypothetical protein
MPIRKSLLLTLSGKLISLPLLLSVLFTASTIIAPAQKTIRVLPKVTDEVLINPGIGFMTFQRFNGDTLNRVNWTEGYPIEYQPFKGDLHNKDYPLTSIAYFRIYWRYLEPAMGKYNWEMIDKALKTAHERQQTLMLRIAPYGSGNDTINDVPAWYRAMVGTKNEWLPEGDGWRVDAEDPKYAKYFGKMIQELGKRYDGHPDLESVDLSIVGFWGEGRGAEILQPQTRHALVDAYTDNFKNTPLVSLLTDRETNQYALSQADVGWRVDCLGDMGGFSKTWSHMMDLYPQSIVNFKMEDAWKKAPISLEVCWVMQKWKAEGWDVNYIIDQSLKWHISSFNAKSSAVPKEWAPYVNQWLNRMGYRFALRNFSYPEYVTQNSKLSFQSWWENKGVAPCYNKNFLLAIRLSNSKTSEVITTDADITSWLPGDNVYDNAVFVPMNMPAGKYQLQVGIVDKQNPEPKVKLAIEGRTNEGWYTLGDIEIKEGKK